MIWSHSRYSLMDGVKEPNPSILNLVIPLNIDSCMKDSILGYVYPSLHTRSIIGISPIPKGPNSSTFHQLHDGEYFKDLSLRNIKPYNISI